jgi:hypothetical protein
MCEAVGGVVSIELAFGQAAVLKTEGSYCGLQILTSSLADVMLADPPPPTTGPRDRNIHTHTASLQHSRDISTLQSQILTVQ